MKRSDSLVTEFFENARVDYLSELASRLSHRESCWVQASLQLDYRGNYISGSDADIEIAVTDVGQSSFTLSYRIYQRELLRVSGNCVLVNLDLKTEKPVPLCNQQRRLLAEERLNFYRLRESSAVGQLSST